MRYQFLPGEVDELLLGSAFLEVNHLEGTKKKGL